MSQVVVVRATSPGHEQQKSQPCQIRTTSDGKLLSPVTVRAEKDSPGENHSVLSAPRGGHCTTRTP